MFCLTPVFSYDDCDLFSEGLLQRRLRIGYPRAARLIDQLEELGVVGPSQGGGKEREVLIGDEESDSDADLNDGDG